MPVTDGLAATALGVAASVLLLGACRGCSSSSPTGAEPLDGGSPGDVRVDRVIDSRPEADAQAEPSVDAAPDVLVDHEGVPPGWEAWTGWSAKCPVYVPGPDAELPPPIEWEPCPSFVPHASGCRVMKNTWGGNVAMFARFWREASSGKPLLAFARTRSSLDVVLVPFIIAEPDGIVRMAQIYPLSDSTKGCPYYPEDFNDGLYVVDAPARLETLSDGGKADVEGAIGGPMTNMTPAVLATTLENSSWRVSKDWLVQLTLGKVNAWTWDGKTIENVYAGGTDPNGLQPHVPIVQGKDIFFTVGNLQLCGVMSWSPTAGLRPLLRWYSDFTRAAGNFGTDGKDMVWTQSQGTGACLNDGPNPEVWTAPYTTDPAVLQATAHRVRKDVRGMSPDSYAVGHGYAARCDFFGSPIASSLSIVRLSDGYAWTVAGDPDAKTHNFSVPFGLTEEEVYVFGSIQGIPMTIFRIRLDSLGPGTPPD